MSTISWHDLPWQDAVRLWSLHPRYLDARGLVAVWREGLLARAVLQGKTKGYRSHPQLERFRGARRPVGLLNRYLLGVYQEGAARGYRFRREKVGRPGPAEVVPVTRGQLQYELSHLRRKLRKRDRASYQRIRDVEVPDPHPVFRAVPGGIEPWERTENRRGDGRDPLHR